VYCAFGTQSHRFAGERALLGAIVAGAARAGVHLVMSVGDAIDSLEAPRGVTVSRRLPQLAILARAQAAIVHGGLGTIKECIWFGVPMLVLPGDHDQPANAARVAHHGLGFARARRGLTADAIAALLRRLLDEGERRERLAAWSRRFRQIEAEERHVAAIESAL
jgi:UDP:flavonoid glycosyltransferase YjiC (YdhE family)